MNDINIQKLDFPDNIRKKPGLYIGNTSNSTVIVRELIDNSLDELMNGYADTVIINSDNSSSWHVVVDNGRGIPIYNDETKDNCEITIDLFSAMHTSGKFDANEASRGLHGLGATATNALSDDFIVIVNVNKNKSTKKLPKWMTDRINELPNNSSPVYLLHNKRGIKHINIVDDYANILKLLVEDVGIPEKLLPDNFIEEFSSMVICKPDSTIFDSVKSHYRDKELKLSKMLSPNSNIIYNGEEIKPFNIKTDSFPSISFIDDKIFSMVIETEDAYEYHNTRKVSKNKFIIAFGYSQEDFSSSTDGSVNTLDTSEGYHINTINKFMQYAFENQFPDMEGRDSLYGLRLFVLAITNAAEYTSQDKVRLGRIYGLNLDNLYDKFKTEYRKLVANNEDYFKGLTLRILEYKAAIGTLSKKNFIQATVIYGDDKRSRGLGTTSIVDCVSRDTTKNELFICEGKSAGGTIRKVRNTETQALLELRGKTLNTTNIEVTEALKNQEILSMINGIGVGINPYVDMSKKRYGKIIIAADSDTDGSHVQILVMAAFATHLPQVIENGMLYLGLAPLYEQYIDGKVVYLWDELQLDRRRGFKRFKGLGSASARCIKDTLLNPETRRLVRVTADMIEEAKDLMGNSFIRKKLMIDNGIYDPSAVDSELLVSDFNAYLKNSLSLEELEIATTEFDRKDNDE